MQTEQLLCWSGMTFTEYKRRTQYNKISSSLSCWFFHNEPTVTFIFTNQWQCVLVGCTCTVTTYSFLLNKRHAQPATHYLLYLCQTRSNRLKTAGTSDWFCFLAISIYTASAGFTICCGSLVIISNKVNHFFFIHKASKTIHNFFIVL